MNNILQIIMLVTALTLDAFVVSISYGADNIKIPFISNIVINTVCSSVLAVSLLFGGFFARFIPKGLSVTLCGGCLVVLGIIKLFDEHIKEYILKKRKRRGGKFLKYILNIYGDCTKADKDFSRVLNIPEAVLLALTLSIDSLAVGFGAGLGTMSVYAVFFCSVLFGLAAVILGVELGKKISDNLGDISWIGGVMLILLGAVKLIF